MASERAELTRVRSRGWTVNDEEIVAGSTNFAAVIMDQGRAVAAIVLSGPTERLTPDQHEHFGRLVAQAATDLNDVLVSYRDTATRNTATSER